MFTMMYSYILTQGAGKLSTCDDGKGGDRMVSNPTRRSADSLAAGKGVVQKPADVDEDVVGEPEKGRWQCETGGRN